MLYSEMNKFSFKGVLLWKQVKILAQPTNLSGIFDEDINLKGLFDILNPENNLVPVSYTHLTLPTTSRV